MARIFTGSLVFLNLFALLLQGCATGTLTDFPSKGVDTWLLGVWKYVDQNGNKYRAGIFPLDSDHYSIEIQSLSNSGKPLESRYFKAFISRVDHMFFLNLLPMGPPPYDRQSVGVSSPTGLTRPFNNTGPLLAHYQLQSPIEMLVTPLHLSVAGEPYPWKLRRDVRSLAKTGVLLPPSHSLYWQKVSEVYWQANASLESQPFQPLRIPIPDKKIPSQTEALQVGPTKGFGGRH